METNAGIKGRVIRPNQAIHLGEDPDKLTPFRVTLLVKYSKNGKEKSVVYYVRGSKKRPDLAVAMADKLWQKWEKFDKGIHSEYPDTLGKAYAEIIDEKDFATAWHDIQKYTLKCRVAGDPTDPMAFTCLDRTDI